MSEAEKKNTSLVSSRSKSLITRSSGLAKRGLELLSSQQERVIHFPPDRSMGMLSVLDLDNPDSEMELEEIRKAQGNITVPMGKYLSLTVSDEAVTDLSYLSKLKPNDLQSLHLPADISDAELIHIQGLTELQELELWRARFTDAGLVNLQGLTGLRSLNLSHNQITDAGLAYLQKLTKLESLDLSKTQITDAGLVNLRPLPELSRLGLVYNRIAGEGLVHLRGLTRLKVLRLGRTKITDAGLVNLQGLTGLRSLDLSHNQITDAGLAYLKN